MTQPQQIILTVDRQGNVANRDQLPPELLAQLSTPETIAKIKKLYRDAHPKGGRRELRKALEEERRRRADGKADQQRCFTAMKPPGMSNKEFAKIRRATLRSYTKQALKMQRRQRNGQPAGNESDHGNGAQSGELVSNSAAESAG